VRRYWRGAAAIAVLSALVAVFYRGIIFQGLVLGDYDAFVYFYPLRQYAADALRQGRFPLWNPNLFMGAPFFANVQTAVLYPVNLLFLALSTPYAYSASVVLHVALAGAGMYLFARRSLEISRLPSILAAVAFMFSGFMSGQVGHINQLTVAAWLPALLVVFDEGVRRRSLTIAIGAGIVGSLQLLAGHTQEWYFSTVTLGLLALWRVMLPLPPRTDVPKLRPLYVRMLPLLFLGIAGVLEIGLTAIQVLPSLELSAESIRGGGMSYPEVVSFSLPPTTMLYTLLPRYPTEMFSEYVGYVGVIPLVLAIVAVLTWALRPVTAFMVGLALLGLFMAIGGYNPLYPELVRHVPGLALFRVPARWLMVYSFGMAGLAGLGAQVAIDLGDRHLAPVARSLREKLPNLLMFAAALFVLVGTFGCLAFLFYLARPRPDYDQFQLWGLLAALCLAMVALSSLGRRVGWAALSVLIAVTAVELFAAGEQTSVRHPIPIEAYKPDRTSTSYLLAEMAKTTDPGRLLSFATDRYEVKETPDYKKQYDWLHAEGLVQFMVDIKLSESMAANVPMEYGIETVDGYDGGILPLKRYGELKSILLPTPGLPPDNQIRINLQYAPSLRMLDLLNVRYILGNKIQDTKMEGVYYDRGISMILDSGASERLRRLPAGKTTSIGLISSTEGARELSDGTEAATMTVKGSNGATYDLPIRLGIETGETPERDKESKPAAHRKPQLVPAWSEDEVSTEYYARVRLPASVDVQEVTVTNRMQSAKIRLRAITLIDEPGGTSAPLVMSDRLDRQLFFDTKLYSYQDPLPRAFMVNSTMVRNDDVALQALRKSEWDLDQVAVLAPSATARTISRPIGALSSRPAVELKSYRPEEAVAQVSTQQDGYLVLLDAFYPGWRAEVDGVETPIERADHFFRGVYVPQGNHTVVFRYAPSSFQIGSYVSAGSTALVLLALLTLRFRWGLRPRRPRR
jgi:hypothetical protein